MWRLGEHLVGQCVYTDQEVNFIGSIAAKIQNIYIGGRKVPAACMTSRTKAIYRSLSAKVTIFIQVCRELWEFAGDGERYNEKIVHSFLPALFAKWKEAGTNHTVTIMLISRVYYDESEIDYAAGPLQRDERGQWYKDFYKVITDLEVIYEWKPTLVSLKNSFWDFQRDILLTHHYHLHGSTEQVRLVGRLSYAHDGPILEALNLGLNPTETHYIDRSLQLTGSVTMLITPGTGYFRVNKQLLRLTTTRMLDQGFGLDLICLEQPPLHQSPIFSFQGLPPDEKVNDAGSRDMDPLWGGERRKRDGEKESDDEREKVIFWWEPFWISVSFWDKQMDLPFREDRFVARAKMHEIQMLGLLEHDVLSSIEVPYLKDDEDQHSPGPSPTAAQQFDNDIFAVGTEPQQPSVNPNRMSVISISSSTTEVISSSYRVPLEKRASHRNSLTTPKVPPIEESPRTYLSELPVETPTRTRNSSPSQSSIHSLRSNLSGYSSKKSITRDREGLSLTSKLTPSWLFKPFRSGPSEPQTSPVSASVRSGGVIPVASNSPTPSTSTLSTPTLATPTISAALPSIPFPSTSLNLTRASDELASHTPQPMAIKTRSTPLRSNFSRAVDSEVRAALARPGSPHDDSVLTATVSSLSVPWTSSSPGSKPNPSKPQSTVSYVQASLAARWRHVFASPAYKHDIKWSSMVTPGCLPLTVEYFPSTAELEGSYDVFSYDFVVDPDEMRSFLIKPPQVKGNAEDFRRAWALVVMRGMAAVRLAQGFQFVLQKPKKGQDVQGDDQDRRTTAFRRHQSFMGISDDDIPKPWGAAEVLKSTANPVYLSMSNEIHRISYTGEAIQVRRYVRRMPSTKPFDYECLIWPKLGVGYTEQKTQFRSHGLENYGWNRLDMLVAGYEHQFNESLRYWRTRFVIIPTLERPTTNTGPTGEKLNDEETRILGWQSPDEKDKGVGAPPVRFLPTTLSPAASVRDDVLMLQLDQIHAAGPLQKKVKSEREIGDMSLSAIAKAMREDDGVPIKNNHWHRMQYQNSFTGFDFVSWLVREFRDVSSRSQGVEVGVRLQHEGFFLDGHYFYRLIGEYAVPSTPRLQSWLPRYDTLTLGRSSYLPTTPARQKSSFAKQPMKRRLILSETMVIDIDTNKRSDQAEAVILHHDIIHNPATVFHFELQWIGTTGRYIEDQLRQWNKTIERYGLKLVEAYVTQISDIRDRNAFQSRPGPPPARAEGTHTAHYFEYALLRRFGFILDVEASDLYPDDVDVVYSYRRSPYKYSQFIHRSGVAFIQVKGGTEGFLFLTNRLMGSGRTRGKEEKRPAVEAEKLRVDLDVFCSDPAMLEEFYRAQVEQLGPMPEGPPEPPPLEL
ncbi:hypothetical protein BDZ89DRAFT_1078965 [Hymenopellis radicata]|nr:hypothetical protein BDZ89DRAFT_1078965 [Hymenopellis radicata]